MLGPTGAGKSFVACALGNQAAREGHSVRYQRLSRLLDELAIGRAEGRYARLLTRLSKVSLLIIDDWLMAKLTADQRRDLMEVIGDRHQRGSTLRATQIPIGPWHDQIGDPTYAAAILDRLIHNAYRIELRDASMRQRQSSTEEKSKANNEISKDIPDTHTIHTRATAATKKDKQTQIVFAFGDFGKIVSPSQQDQAEMRAHQPTEDVPD